MKFLDRNANRAILLAGIITLFLGVGVARFAFTSLLPLMLEDFLNITLTGYLASLNFVGYLSGAIFAATLKDLNKKVFFFRVGMVLSVITTLILAFSTNETLWLISRIIAGFGTAMTLLVGSSIVMLKLNFKDKTKAMGIHFSGLGIAILLSDLIVRFVTYLNYSWKISWLVLALFGLLLAIYAIYILSFDKIKETKLSTDAKKKSIFSFFVVVLTIAYFTEGVGFVVQATFLPDIINSLPGLEGYGSYTWTIVGISAIPSTMLLMNLAHKYGSVNVIILSMLLQVVGILIPTLTTNIYANLFSGVLYGGTFAGLVALFMHLGGKLVPHNPVVLMATFTTAYGIGQVSAPLYSVYYINKYGNYDVALYVTATIVALGALLLFVTKKKHVE